LEPGSAEQRTVRQNFLAMKGWGLDFDESPLKI
jgi:hypothetical protein